MSDEISTIGSTDLLSLMLPSLCSTEIEEDGLGFYGEKNLFHRIIRNPSPYGRLPKERECAEMLCGCLIHMPVFRLAFLKRLAEMAWQTVDLESLRFHFSTERPILGKRDDLRIEGFGENGDLQLIWTLEIKVRAGFHYSSRVKDVEESDERNKEDSTLDIEPEFVNQLENYDTWLSLQKGIPHKAGFVLSISNQKENLPGCLKNPWGCLTWYDLAEELRIFFQTENMPEDEQFLGRHLLGFIEQALGGREMDNRLQIEDVAFYKVYCQQGRTTLDKITNLVKAVSKRFENLEPLNYSVEYDDYIFISKTRNSISTFWWRLEGPDGGGWPCLCAGIASDTFPCIIVYVSTDPKHPKKNEIRGLITKKIGALQSENPEWEIVSPEMSRYWDIKLITPLEILLGQEDQEEWLYQHFKKAFEDLIEVGIIKGIQDLF